MGSLSERSCKNLKCFACYDQIVFRGDEICTINAVFGSGNTPTCTNCGKLICVCGGEC